MKRILVVLLLVCVSCKDTSGSKNTEAQEMQVPELHLQELQVVDYDGLEPYLNQDDNTLHVVNFWATWCAPCVKELPYFEALASSYDNIEVLLVSLDFPNKYETKLIPFIEKYELKSKVIALDDTDQNRWIPAINESWSGAIPATLIYKGQKRKFYERSFTQNELKTEIEQFLN
ncbi:TlpA family protein disulfide reductase [Winogradskyella aurantia]|uniref:Thioredoxin n=1 Tax=Winogradskyella aurantia TaxID=1915063 RepID=A0A265UUT3_9FLAO|nr:TlpA disulfide reductase family protein [Winogradskyella aurantia]OZV69066.1 thioredoxin [Winogradskyella aurantia]